MDYFQAFKELVTGEKVAGKTAVFFDGRATTYGELLDEAERVSSALLASGVRKGDVVGIYMANCPRFLALFLGIARCGAVAEPVNPLLTAYEIQPQLEQTKAKILFVSPAHLGTVRQMKSGLPEVEEVVLTSGEGEDARAYSDFLAGAREDSPAAGLHDDDTALILFTGGTTGIPKGVLLTHRNLLSVVQGLRNRLGSLGEMVALCASPLSHIFGLNTITFASLFRRCTVVLMEWFQVEEAARLIESYRVSNIFGVPTVVRSLLDVSPKYDFRCLRLVLAGAAPVPEELYERVEKSLHCHLIEGWGLTEGSGCSTVTPPGVRKVGSCGIPYDGIDIECAVVDKDDRPLPPGQVGELVQRGVLNMKGYLGNPEATAEALRDGWLHTGDLARMDEDGYIYIVDRKKDVIIRGGFNIYPAEVEAVLYTVPGVAEAAVFGVSDPRKGETVAAAIRPAPGMNIREEEAIVHCRERLARFKVPKYIQIRDAPLPKTAAGKILRRALKEELEKKLKER